jgi:hypothetical protein
VADESMPRKRTVDEVLSKDAVHSVREETPFERIARLLLSDINRVTALLVIVVGMIGCVVIMAAAESLRAAAFQLFSTIVSGALGFFFATRSSR